MAGHNHSKIRFLPIFIALILIGEVFGASTDWVTFKGNYLRNSFTQTFVEPEVQRVEWKHKTGNSGISCSPTTFKNFIYICSESGFVYCLEADDGSRAWEFPNNSLKDYTEEDDSGNVVRPFPNGSIDFPKTRLNVPPTVYNNYVYVPYGQMLIVLNADSGRFFKRFNLASQKASITTSPIISPTHKLVIVGASNGWLYGFDIDGRDPAIRWKFPESASTGDIIESSPALVGNNLYFGSNSRNFYCAELKIPGSSGARPQDKPELKWMAKLDGPASSSPAFSTNNKLIVCTKNGKVYGISSGNGNIAWTYDAGGQIDGSPAVAPGKVVFVSKKTVFCLDETNGRSIWDNLLSDESYATPAIGGNYVYLTTRDGKLVVYNLSSGGQVSVKRVSEAVRSSPAIAYNKVFFGTEEGNIYALVHGEDPPTLSASKTSLTFNVQPNTKMVFEESFYVENIGGGNLDVQFSSSRNWITVDPDSIKLAGGRAQYVKVAIDTQRLSPGRYSGIIKAISNGGSSSIQMDILVNQIPDIQIVLTVGETKAFVNGQLVKLDTKPYKTISGSIMVPLRFVVESFECQVDWDQLSKSITITNRKRGIIVKLWIGKNISEITYVNRPELKPVKVYMSDPPVINNGRTMVPVQFMVGAFDARWYMLDAARIKIVIKGA